MEELQEYGYCCPKTGKEGTIHHPLPAGELCPGCGRIKGKDLNQCNFTLFKTDNLLTRIQNSPLRELWMDVESPQV